MEWAVEAGPLPWAASTDLLPNIYITGSFVPPSAPWYPSMSVGCPQLVQNRKNDPASRANEINRSVHSHQLPEEHVAVYIACPGNRSSSV